MSPSQQQTAIGFFQKLSNHDYDGIASSFSDKFEHAFLPASLGGLGQATRNKNQFLQFLKDTERLIASFNVSSMSDLKIQPGKPVGITFSL